MPQLIAITAAVVLSMARVYAEGLSSSVFVVLATDGPLFRNYFARILRVRKGGVMPVRFMNLASATFIKLIYDCKLRRSIL